LHSPEWRGVERQWRLGLAAVVFAVPTLLSQSVTDTTAFACPATITIGESAAPPWRMEVAKDPGKKGLHKFLRPSIYNGTPGKEEYDLAPDDEQTQGRRVRQSWKLSDYRDNNLFLRCRYAGTGATLVVNLPLPLKTCTFTFQNTGSNQPIAAPEFSCK
jgi:hypothetical protein